MAAPMVTGAAGVVASVTGLRGAALRQRLLSTADDLGATGYDTQFGAGRVNLRRAIANETNAITYTAAISKSCSTATCSFDGSGSQNASTYSWKWADQSSSTSGATTSRTFSSTGTYSLTLTTNAGTANARTATSTVSCSLTVNRRLRCQ
jgi:PKD repeat protein